MNSTQINLGRTRRGFLSDLGTGFGAIALAAMQQRETRGESSTLPSGLPHFAAKAKSVIWLFMAGGVSQVETFDPKPELTKHAGKTTYSIWANQLQANAQAR